jgi:hypothetical protein
MKYFLSLICALVTGCLLTVGPRYSLQAFDLGGGSIVLFNCNVNQYTNSWRSQAETSANKVFAIDLSRRSQPRESIVILDISLSEGGWAGVLAVIGTRSFTDEWVAKGCLEAGLKTAEMRAINKGPNFAIKGSLREFDDSGHR